MEGFLTTVRLVAFQESGSQKGIIHVAYYMQNWFDNWEDLPKLDMLENEFPCTRLA